MLKAFKYRIYPNKAQELLINKHLGAARFIYNLALETKNNAYYSYGVNLSRFALQKQLPDLKAECAWLTEVNSQSLQSSIKNLDTAFKRFFDGKSKFPKYKSKWNGKQSFQIPQNVKVSKNRFFSNF